MDYCDSEEEWEPLSDRLGIAYDPELARILDTRLESPVDAYRRTTGKDTRGVRPQDLYALCNSRDFAAGLLDKEMAELFSRRCREILDELKSWGSVSVRISGQLMCVLRKIHQRIDTDPVLRAILILPQKSIFAEFYPSLAPISAHVRDVEAQLSRALRLYCFPHIADEKNHTFLSLVVHAAAESKLLYSLVQQEFSASVDALWTTIRQCENPTVQRIKTILAAYDRLVELYPEQSAHAHFVLYGLFQHYEMFYQFEIDEWVQARDPITNWRQALGEYVDERPDRINAGNIREVPPLDLLTNAFSSGFEPPHAGECVVHRTVPPTVGERCIFRLPQAAKNAPPKAQPPTKCTHCSQLGHKWRECPQLDAARPDAQAGIALDCLNGPTDYTNDPDCVGFVGFIIKGKVPHDELNLQTRGNCSVTHTLSNLSDYRPFDQPKVVHLDGSAPLPVLGSGQVRFLGQSLPSYYAPDLAVNVIAWLQVMELGRDGITLSAAGISIVDKKTGETISKPMTDWNRYRYD